MFVLNITTHKKIFFNHFPLSLGALLLGIGLAQGRTQSLKVMAPLSPGLPLVRRPGNGVRDYLFGLVTPDSLSPELRLMETRSNNHLERDTLPPAIVTLRLSIAAPLAT